MTIAKRGKGTTMRQRVKNLKNGRRNESSRGPKKCAAGCQGREQWERKVGVSWGGGVEKDGTSGKKSNQKGEAKAKEENGHEKEPLEETDCGRGNWGGKRAENMKGRKEMTTGRSKGGRSLRVWQTKSEKKIPPQRTGHEKKEKRKRGNRSLVAGKKTTRGKKKKNKEHKRRTRSAP